MSQPYHSRNLRVASVLLLAAWCLAGGSSTPRAEPVTGENPRWNSALPDRNDYEIVPVDLDPVGRVLLRADHRTTGKSRAFVNEGADITELAPLAAGSTVPLEMDAAGRVVGKSQDPSGRWMPCVWEGGQIRTLPVPAGFDGAEARSIAPDGIIGGNLFRGERQRAVLWTDPGLQVLPLPAPYASSRVEDVASGKRAVGTLFHATSRLNQGRAVLWSDVEPPRDLGVLPGHTYSQARAINERGQVVGVSTEQPFDRWQQGFLWTDGVLKGLDRYGINSEALDINAQGDVAGATEENAPFLQRVLYAARWMSEDDHGLRFFRLEPTSAYKEGRRAVANNDAGQYLLSGNFGWAVWTPPAAAGESPLRHPAAEPVDEAPRALLPRNECDFLCSMVRSLRVDLLNDPEPIPHALNLRRGSVPADRLAGFKVYGINGIGSVYDLTYPYFMVGSRRPHNGRVTVRAEPGISGLKARVYYAELGGSPRLYLKFQRPPRQDRTVTLTFSFNRHEYGVLRTTYTLKVKGLAGR